MSNLEVVEIENCCIICERPFLTVLVNEIPQYNVCPSCWFRHVI